MIWTLVHFHPREAGQVAYSARASIPVPGKSIRANPMLIRISRKSSLRYHIAELDLTPRSSTISVVERSSTLLLQTSPLSRT